MIIDCMKLIRYDNVLIRVDCERGKNKTMKMCV